MTVSAETIEADLREELDRLDQTLAAALRAYRASPGRDLAETAYRAARQVCSLGHDLATVLGDSRLERPWRPRALEDVERWSPRLRPGAGQKPVFPTPWREKLDALRRLRGAGPS